MVQNAKTLLTKTLIPAALLAGITQVNASPVTDDCTAGSGCIQTAGGKGVFNYFAKFYADTHTSVGQFSYSDENFTISSDQLTDYADPEGMGGYRILSFSLNDPDYPDHHEVRIVIDDLGDATEDTFEIQIHGSPFYAVSGKLLASCSGGIAISQECGTEPGPEPCPPTGSNPIPPASTQCDDFVTGGGWIIGPGGKKANFGIRGGVKRGLWGGLNYLDHKTRMHVKSTAVVGYTHFSENGREITYNVNINGTPGTAVVRVVDNGEPGRNDTFEITLSNGYKASGDLGGTKNGGGNIQLHKAKCDKPAKDKNKAKDDEDKNRYCKDRSNGKCKDKTHNHQGFSKKR